MPILYNLSSEIDGYTSFRFNKFNSESHVRLWQGSIPCCLIEHLRSPIIVSEIAPKAINNGWRVMKRRQCTQQSKDVHRSNVRCGGTGKRYPKLRLKEAKKR